MGLEPTYEDIKKMGREEFQGFMAERIDRYHSEALSVGVQVASIQKTCNRRGWVCRGLIGGASAMCAAAWAWITGASKA